MIKRKESLLDTLIELFLAMFIAGVFAYMFWVIGDILIKSALIGYIMMMFVIGYAAVSYLRDKFRF